MENYTNFRHIILQQVNIGMHAQMHQQGHNMHLYKGFSYRPFLHPRNSSQFITGTGHAKRKNTQL